MDKPTKNYQFDYRFLELTRTILKNTSAIIIGHILTLLLSLATSVILLRYLGSEKIGQYSALYAYLTLFSWLTTLGMDQVIVRKAAQREGGEVKHIVGTATILVALFSIFATALAMLSAIILGYVDGLRVLLFLAAIDLLLLTPLRMPGMVFQLYFKQWHRVGISVGRQLLWLIILGLAVLMHLGLPAIILGRLLCGTAEALGILLFSCRFVKFSWRHWKMSLAKNIIGNSWPIGLAILTGNIYHRIDQVMLHALTGDQQLGYFVAAVNIVEIFSIFPVALMHTIFPILSKIALQKEDFGRYISLSFRYLMIIAFALSAIVTIGSPLIIHLLCGRQYGPSVNVLSILVWSETGVFLGVIICNALIAKGLQRFIPLSTSVGAVINVALNLVFIPKWGIIGAAWATLITYNITGVIVFLFIPVSRKLALEGIKVSVYPLIAALFCIMTLRLLPNLVSMILACVLYLVILFILRVWDKNDIRLLFASIRWYGA